VPLSIKQAGCCKTLLKKQSESWNKFTPKAEQTMKPLRLLSLEKGQETFQKKSRKHSLQILSAHYDFSHQQRGT